MVISNRSRSVSSRSMDSGPSWRRPHRGRHPTRAARSTLGGSTGSSRDTSSSGGAGTRSSGSSCCSFGLLKAGTSSASPASDTIARRSWECRSAPLPSAPRWSAASTATRSCGRRSPNDGSATSKPGSSPATPLRKTYPRWIEQAQDLTCIELRRRLHETGEAKMCARGQFSLWLPGSVATLLKGAFRALRTAAQRWMWVEDCLLALAAHFIETYRHLLQRAKTLQRRVRARDRHVCQVPGCSRPAVHAHHIVPRSQGGTDDPANLVSLCASHHLNGIHGGRIRVTGTAPHALRWEFGLRRSYAETAVP